jgi:hypothetical protein
MMEGHLRRAASFPTPSKKTSVQRRGKEETTHFENKFGHSILKDHDQLDGVGINAKGPEERQRSLNSKFWPFATK